MSVAPRALDRAHCDVHYRHGPTPRVLVAGARVGGAHPPEGYPRPDVPPGDDGPSFFGGARHPQEGKPRPAGDLLSVLREIGSQDPPISQVLPRLVGTATVTRAPAGVIRPIANCVRPMPTLFMPTVE